MECKLCLRENDISSTTGLCRFCAIVDIWIPVAITRYESEMKSLSLRDTPNRLYWVYVLDTDLGTYVGQTNNIERRPAEHDQGRVRSTVGANPSLIWHSQPLRSRKTADNYERVLKTLRDMAHEDFHAITGVHSEPFLGGDVNRIVRLGEPFIHPETVDIESWTNTDCLQQEYSSPLPRKNRRFWKKWLLGRVLLYIYHRRRSSRRNRTGKAVVSHVQSDSVIRQSTPTEVSSQDNSKDSGFGAGCITVFIVLWVLYLLARVLSALTESQ